MLSFFGTLGAGLFCLGDEIVQSQKTIRNARPYNVEQGKIHRELMVRRTDPVTGHFWNTAAAMQNMFSDQLRMIRVEEECERRGIPFNPNQPF